jgi:hypothetical protein
MSVVFGKSPSFLFNPELTANSELTANPKGCVTDDHG